MAKEMIFKIEENDADGFLDLIKNEILQYPDEDETLEMLEKVEKTFEKAHKEQTTNGVVSINIEEGFAREISIYCDNRASELVEQCYDSSGLRLAAYYLAIEDAIDAVFRERKRQERKRQ